jgi:hypothetical protein
MTLQEVEQLAGKDGVSHEAGRSFVGRHRVSRGYTHLWLQFGEGLRLQSYVLERPESFQWVRLSPRRNLCTGELTYQLRLHPRADELLDAVVYVDGQRMGSLGEVDDLELAAGDHELRIEPHSYPNLVQRLRLGPGDRGDQLLGVELVSANGIQQRLAVRPVRLK